MKHMSEQEALEKLDYLILFFKNWMSIFPDSKKINYDGKNGNGYQPEKENCQENPIPPGDE